MLLRLRPLAMSICVVAAIVSLACMYRVGHGNRSVILMLLFTVWVASPFVGLLIGALKSGTWPARSRSVLHGIMLIVSLLAILVYNIVAFGPPRPQPAFAFLMVPLGSWCLVVVVIVINWCMGGARSQR
jgi:hypothetical protein